MTVGPGSAPAYRCEVCGQWPDWRLERHGDAAVSWACSGHLPLVVDDMRRPVEKFGPTRFTVTEFEAEAA